MPAANRGSRNVVPTQTTLYLDATIWLLGDVEDGVSFCVVEAGVMGLR